MKYFLTLRGQKYRNSPAKLRLKPTNTLRIWFPTGWKSPLMLIKKSVGFFYHWRSPEASGYSVESNSLRVNFTGEKNVADCNTKTRDTPAQPTIDLVVLQIRLHKAQKGSIFLADGFAQFIQAFNISPQNRFGNIELRIQIDLFESIPGRRACILIWQGNSSRQELS